jgi:hypothetical protein
LVSATLAEASTGNAGRKNRAQIVHEFFRGLFMNDLFLRHQRPLNKWRKMGGSHAIYKTQTRSKYVRTNSPAA